MDWEAEGLLEGLEDEQSRAARSKLLDHLHEDEGCSVDELREAVREDRLVLLPVERFLSGEETFSQREIAEESGLELAHLAEFRQALGLAVPDPDSSVLTGVDLDTAKDAAALAVFAGSRAAERLEKKYGTLGVIASDLPAAIAEELCALERLGD